VRILHFVQPLPTGPDVNDLSHTYAHTHILPYSLCVCLSHIHACTHLHTHSLDHSHMCTQSCTHPHTHTQKIKLRVSNTNTADTLTSVVMRTVKTRRLSWSVRPQLDVSDVYYYIMYESTHEGVN